MYVCMYFSMSNIWEPNLVYKILLSVIISGPDIWGYRRLWNLFKDRVIYDPFSREGDLSVWKVILKLFFVLQQSKRYYNNLFLNPKSPYQTLQFILSF